MYGVETETPGKYWPTVEAVDLGRSRPTMSSAMHTFNESTRRQGVRPDYILIGVDTKGAEHIYRTFDETVLVINGCDVVERFDLIHLRKSVNDWIEHVIEVRGFEEQYLHVSLGDAIESSFKGEK